MLTLYNRITLNIFPSLGRVQNQIYSTLCCILCDSFMSSGWEGKEELSFCINYAKFVSMAQKFTDVWYKHLGTIKVIQLLVKKTNEFCSF